MACRQSDRNDAAFLQFAAVIQGSVDEHPRRIRPRREVRAQTGGDPSYEGESGDDEPRDDRGRRALLFPDHGGEEGKREGGRRGEKAGAGGRGPGGGGGGRREGGG